MNTYILAKNLDISKTNINKIINARCHCGMGLPWMRDEIILIEPCEHLIHLKCHKKAYCMICKTHITNIIRLKDLLKNPKLYQKCIDILSMTNFDHMSDYDFDKIFDNIPTLMSAILKAPFTKGIKEGKDFLTDIFSMNNIDIIVKGHNKIKKGPKVFIANHTSMLDSAVLFYVLETGFLSSNAITENFVSNQLTDIIPLLIIDRGKSYNVVDKMKKYVEKTGSICLFPEGIMTHPDTIIRFRTGAFHIGYPVYPVILKYDPIVADSNTGDFIFKISSGQKIKIDVIIMDPYYGPFSDAKMEQVRKDMAICGNMMLSRVSNRDIKEISS